jgi:hypothetical protein
MQKIYQGKSPDVQAAIGVILDPNASDEDVGSAMMYLQQKGIDVNKLTGSSKTPPSNTTPGLPSGRPISLGF